MAATLLLTFFTYLVSLALLPFLALIFVRIYGTGWRLFFGVVVLQGVIGFALLVPVLTGLPDRGRDHTARRTCRCCWHLQCDRPWSCTRCSSS